MAKRPIFIPQIKRGPLIEVVMIDIVWHGGFSLSQKQRNIRELHEKARIAGIAPVLEISTKSPEEVGRRLSAFSLKIEASGHLYSLESVYQSSKVFSDSGQHISLIEAEPFEAKRRIRELGKGRIVSFRFEGKDYPTEPVNAFYDWLYIRAIAPYESWIRSNLHYAAYSDIEFNPERSVNCQGRAVAEFQALSMRGSTLECVHDFKTFRNILAYSQRHDVA